MRVAIAGSGRLAACLIRSLLDSPHDVIALVQNGRVNRGLKRHLTASAGYAFGPQTSVLGLATRNDVPVLWIDRMDDVELAPLHVLQPDVLLVGGFSIILKRPILDLPRLGCVNCHSSLLPKHRGPNPFSAAILAQDTETGVTFHIVDEGIDTGDVLEQYAFDIGPKDTAMHVYQNCCVLAGDQVVGVMDRIEAKGRLEGTPQDHDAATYDPRLTEHDVRIDWAQPVADIERMTRACRPFFLARFRSRGKTVYLTQLNSDETEIDATPGTVISSSPLVRVATGRGSLTVVSAYCATPIPWRWPAPWNRPKPGEQLD